MKKEPAKKLAAYSSMALSLTLLTDQTQAQVTYFDIDPDLVPAGGSIIPLDIDGDGIHEVDFRHFTLGSNCYGNMGLDEYRVSAMTDGNGGPKIFNYGDPLTWSYATDYNVVYFNKFYAPDDVVGEMIGLGDKYIGIFFESGAETINAWLRVAVDTCGYVVKDYAYSAGDIFAGQMPCEPPVPIGSINLTSTSVKVKWSAVPGVTKYHIRYKPEGSSAWQNKIVNAPAVTKKLTGLSCDADYMWQIRALCSDGSFSAFSEMQNFSTGACRLSETNASASIFLYPNPTQNTITFSIESETEGASIISVSDMSGNIMIRQTMVNAPMENFVLDVKNLANGIYILEIKGSEKYLYSQFVVQH